MHRRRPRHRRPRRAYLTAPGLAAPPRVAAIVPAYRVRAQIEAAVAGAARFVDAVYVVDDACPERSGRHVPPAGHVHLLVHPANQGVGAATVTGYRAAGAAGFDLLVKFDGDGQMDPAYIPALLAPLRAGTADYAKGDRLASAETMRAMPRARRLGNRLITRLACAMAGRPVRDPMNGFTAVTAATLARLDLDALDRRFFFETDLLVRLVHLGARIVDIPMPARYGAERSNIGIGHILRRFPPKIAAGLLRRVARARPPRLDL